MPSRGHGSRISQPARPGISSVSGERERERKRNRERGRGSERQREEERGMEKLTASVTPSAI